MIWTTISSWSCFCDYRTSLSSAANITNLILVLTILWCSCAKTFLVLLELVIATVLAITSALSSENSVRVCLLHFVFQGQRCLLLQVSLHFLLLYSSLLWWKGHLFLVLVLEGLVGIHRTIQLQLLKHYWSGHRLGSLWHWMVCLGNEQRSFCVFWDRIQVLHFGLFHWLWWLLHFF